MLSNGEAAVLILPRGEGLRHQDVLTDQQGNGLRIIAAEESLLEITAPNEFALMRLVYHLANRHVQAMLAPEAIYIEPDPILADLAQRLGGQVRPCQKIFEPESGAYSGHHASHGHSHHPADDLDRQMGNIGEALSKAAHAERRP
jgi:urease accessory protein